MCTHVSVCWEQQGSVSVVGDTCREISNFIIQQSHHNMIHIFKCSVFVGVSNVVTCDSMRDFDDMAYGVEWTWWCIDVRCCC